MPIFVYFSKCRLEVFLVFTNFFVYVKYIFRKMSALFLNNEYLPYFLTASSGNAKLTASNCVIAMPSLRKLFFYLEEGEADRAGNERFVEICLYGNFDGYGIVI